MLAVGKHVLGDMQPMWVRMTTGLAGGFGALQEACGVLSVGVMVIGGACGRSLPDEEDDLALALAARYTERFLSEVGHTACAPLREMVEAPGHSGDQLDRRSLREIVEASGELRSCAELVERGVMLLLEVLDEAEDPDALLEWYAARMQG